MSKTVTPFDDFEFKKDSDTGGKYFRHKNFPHTFSCNLDVHGAVGCIQTVYRKSENGKANAPQNLNACYGSPQWYFEYDKETGKWFTYNLECKRCFSQEEVGPTPIAEGGYMESVDCTQQIEEEYRWHMLPNEEKVVKLKEI